MEVTAELQGTKPQQRVIHFTTNEEGSVKPELPSIAINIFYGSHQSAEDQKRLGEAFQKADVYVPEVPGWNPETLKIFRSVSDGRLEPRDAIRRLGNFFRESRLAELKILYNSKKPVIFVDVPVRHPIDLRIVSQLNRLSESIDFLVLNTFRGNIEGVREVIRNFAQTQKEREDYMLLNLKPKIEEFLKEHPELKGKKKLDILLNLGAVHTNLYRSLKKDNQEVGRTFNDMPTIFSHTEEGIRRSLFGKDIKDELAAKIILELLFKDELEQWTSEKTKDSIEQNKIYRAIFSQISIKDAEDLFNRARRSKNLKMLFYDMLEERGLRKPKIREDVEKLLVPA